MTDGGQDKKNTREKYLALYDDTVIHYSILRSVWGVCEPINQHSVVICIYIYFLNAGLRGETPNDLITPQTSKVIDANNSISQQEEGQKK